MIELASTVHLLSMQDHWYRDPSRFGLHSTGGQTSVHPLGIGMAAVFVWFLLGRRPISKWLGLLGTLAFLTDGQRIVVAGVDFPFARLVLIAGVIVTPRLFSTFRYMSPAAAVFFVLMTVSPTVCTVIRGDIGAAATFSAGAFDMLLAACIAFAWVQGQQDKVAVVADFAKALSIIAIAYFPYLLIERSIGYNAFSVLGGVSPIPEWRNGQFRVQGAIDHPILLGCWFATTYAFALVLAEESRRMLWRIAVVCSLGNVWLCGSSTPIIGVLSATLGWMFLHRPAWIRPMVITSGLLAAIVHVVSGFQLHRIMFTKVPVLSGSTGYHRFALLDGAMKHFGDWWLIGSGSTYAWGWGLDDITNQYVAAGVFGGLAGVVGLVGMFIWAARASLRVIAFPRYPAWRAIFPAVCSNCVMLVSITYFGQTRILLALLFGLAAGTDALALAGSRRQVNRRGLVTSQIQGRLSPLASIE